MASGNVNDLNDSAENIREVFAEISNLVDELNKNLAQTVGLTQNVANNLAQSNDKTKESTKNEADREKVLKNIQSLSKEERKALAEGLKTGKGLTKELAAKVGLEGKSGTLAGTAAMMKLRSLKLQEKEIKYTQEQLKNYEKLSAILDGIGSDIMDQFITEVMNADKEITQLARDVNMTREQAIGVKREFAEFALNSGDVALNSSRLVKANTELNSQLGTAAIFSGEMAGTFSKLTQLVGISAEAAGSLAFQSQRSGKSFREVEEDTLKASHNLQVASGVALDMKGILEATGKVSGQLRAQLGANPENIAKAVTKAKLLGAELEDLANAGKQLLEFESSIENELEAELLTGKQLNLEKARAAALAGDQATLADELAKNMGSFSDFTKMNTLQQDALAKSMGMSSNQLSDMLFKQETMGMNAKQLRAVGKDELADRLEQLDTQEKIALAQEKFAVILGDIGTAVLPIVEAFGKVFEFIFSTKEILAPMVGIVAALGARTAALAVQSGFLAVKNAVSAAGGIMQAFAQIPFGIGIPMGLAAVGAMYALLRKPPKVKDGYSPASRGPFTIMDNYGARGTTTVGDAIDIGPNVGKSTASSPIIINNTWDAFAASNGNGRRGLGGTQELQASPVMV